MYDNYGNENSQKIVGLQRSVIIFNTEKIPFNNDNQLK